MRAACAACARERAGRAARTHDSASIYRSTGESAGICVWEGGMDEDQLAKDSALALALANAFDDAAGPRRQRHSAAAGPASPAHKVRGRPRRATPPAPLALLPAPVEPAQRPPALPEFEKGRWVWCTLPKLKVLWPGRIWCVC